MTKRRSSKIGKKEARLAWPSENLEAPLDCWTVTVAEVINEEEFETPVTV